METKRRGGRPSKEPYKITPFSLSLRALAALGAITAKSDEKKTAALERLIFEEAKRRGIAVPDVAAANE